MSDLDAAIPLVRAIEAAPEDDAPWLAYSDWLEENGRAEEGVVLRTVLPAARPLVLAGMTFRQVMTAVSRLADQGYAEGPIILSGDSSGRYVPHPSVDKGPTCWERVARAMELMADRVPAG